MLTLRPPEKPHDQLLALAASGRGRIARNARRQLSLRLHAALAEGLGKPLPAAMKGNDHGR